MKTCTLWNDHWKFVKEDAGPAAAADAHGKSVTLPHTWNAVDGQDGGNDYYRGTCWYVKKFARPPLEAGEEAWLEFRGAAMTAVVWLNGRKLARHEGGYSTFRANLAEALEDENVLAVSVDNGKNRAVYPQKADFTFYGGIYRDVYLLTVPAVHFALDYHGAPALKVTPKVSEDRKTAEVTVETWITGDAERVAFSLDGPKKDAAVNGGASAAMFTLENVHLWNGVEDPYLYTITAELPGGDTASARFGCRSFRADPEKGFKEGYFSVLDAMGEVKAHARAGAVLTELLEPLQAKVAEAYGDVAKNVQIPENIQKMMDRMSVQDSLKQMGSLVTPEFVHKLNAALNQVKK